MEKSPPYIKFGNMRSNDKSNPDEIQFRVLETETFESDLSTNVLIEQKIDNEWQETFLPLKSHDSDNSYLLKFWQDGVKKKIIQKGIEFSLKTWLGLSKNKRVIRRFDLIF